VVEPVRTLNPWLRMSTVVALDQISTRWSQLGDPLRFVMRYSQAIRAYLEALLREHDLAEEACQEFLARFFERGLDLATPDRGRFRDYLKIAARNTALSLLRRKQATPVDPVYFDQLASVTAGDIWTREWQRVVLDKAWRQLEAHERSAPESLYFTSLRLIVAYPDETSTELAGRASRHAQRTIAPAAFRKQLSRARRRFAELIVAEVAATLHSDARRDLREELTELGLLPFVRDYVDVS
jgi:hypothetical protein